MPSPSPEFARTTSSDASVILLNDALGSAADWLGMAEHLACRFRSIATAAPDRLEGMLAAAVTSVHVIAEGTAATTALRAAAAAPWRIRSLTLIDPDVATALARIAGRVPPGFAAMRAAFDTHCREGEPRHAMRNLVDYRMGPGAWDRSSPRLRQRLARRTGDWTAAMAERQARPFAGRDLAACVCPSLVITGREAGAGMREIHRRLCTALPFVRSVLIEGAKAAAHRTDPHVVDPLVCAFLVQADGRWHDGRAAPKRAA